MFFFFLMIRLPPRSTRSDTLFPYTTLFRSVHIRRGGSLRGLIRDRGKGKPMRICGPHRPLAFGWFFDGLTGAGRQRQADSESKQLAHIRSLKLWLLCFGCANGEPPKIGRASCREMVCRSVWNLVFPGALKK